MKNWGIYLVITIMTVVLLVLNFFIYLTITGFLDITSHSWLVALRIIFIVLALSFPLASAATFRFNNFLTRIFYRLSCWWLGTFLYVLAALFLLCLTVLIFGLTAGSTTIAMVLIGFYGLAILLGIYGLINASWLRITKINVALPNLPPHWKNKSIVFISDTHFGQVRALGFAKKLRWTIEGLGAEAVLFGGDFYDGVMMDFESVANEFGKIRTRLGTFFVTGNHEGYTDFARSPRVKAPLNALRDAGIHLLADGSTDLDGILLSGADFASSEKKEDFIKILKSFHAQRHAAPLDRPHILLKHTPFFIEEAAEAGISLELCGHTHRGQQFPFSLITHKVFKGHDYGLTRSGPMQIYTSSGAGTWGPCLRIGTKSEIALITFV